MNTKKEIKPYISWDTTAILEAQANYLIEIGTAKNTEDSWTMACEDQFLLDDQWENLLVDLTDKLNEINPDGYWHVEVENYGWRNISGQQDIEAVDARTFLSKILPATDCTFHVYIDESHPFKEIKIQNFHHDSPVGNEWYTILARDAFEEAA
ncbi:MAG: hypothetical protein L3J75_15945 [Methylococcaceae bacterium]|nr:hypothetical protein [Methylococcaceae bacterium]